MIEFPCYKVACDKFEVITEDPDMLKEYITEFLEKSNEVIIKRLR